MNDARRSRGAVSRASIAVAGFSTASNGTTSPSIFTSPPCFRGCFSAQAQPRSGRRSPHCNRLSHAPARRRLFGQIGDRLGRRRTMLLSVAVMTLTMLGTALLPTHAQAGAAAGALLFSRDASWGFRSAGNISRRRLSARRGAARRRGLIASLASAVSEIGGLTAVGVSLPDRPGDERRQTQLVGMADTVSRRRGTRGERVDRPRGDGGIAGLREPTGKRHGARQPLRHALAHHRTGVVRAFAISALGSITYYVGITYVPTFLSTAGSFTKAKRCACPRSRPSPSSS